MWLSLSIYESKETNMNIQTAYNEWSESYDAHQNLTRDLDARVLREIFVNQKFDSILETGCGTGKNTVFLAQIGQRVHALDFSQGMIEKAKAKVQAENVRFETADLTKRWQCEDSAYDLIVCCLVLEHIANLNHIFSETARTLTQGGKFFINELHPFKQYQGTKARFEKGTTIIEVDVFVHHISDFIHAAEGNGLKLERFDEYWHADNQGKPPRLISLLFEKA